MVSRPARVLRIVRTARHLRWQQWAYRPLRMLQRGAPAPAAPPATLDEGCLGRLGDALLARGPGDAEGRIARADEVCAGRFVMLGHEQELRNPDWRTRYVSHLWNYNLHYFEYALDLVWAQRLTGRAAYGQRLAALVTDWIRATADGQGDGWEPYPLSVRILNWIQVLALAPAEFPRAALGESLSRQLAFLERRLEWHLLGNHLLKNLCALVTGGLIFSGEAPRRWRERGARDLWAQVREQVPADGMHFERSPMYHAIALADLVDVLTTLAAAGVSAPGDVLQRVRTMRGVLPLFTRTDGSLHLFNDCANGIAPSAASLERWAEPVLGKAPARSGGLWELPDAGFAGYRGEDRLVVDCGAPGPSYQPGHAHCGLLGYELELQGAPVVVDSGVHGYDGDPYREYVRSTRAHSTVAVDGGEQSELWGTFRVARRARVEYVRVGGADGEARIEAAYRPYHPRGVLHQRSFTRLADGWEVADRVLGAPGVRVESFVHLHPDLHATVEDGLIVARGEGRVVVLEPSEGVGVTLHRGESDPAQGWYCPQFGVALPATAVRLFIESNSGREFGYRIRTG